jgi:hypothetical protein
VVGRDAELAAIADLLDGTAAGPAVLVLAGEAGIGKTTLWRAGVRAAEERHCEVLACRPAATEVRLGYAGLADLLSGIGADPRRDDRARVARLASRSSGHGGRTAPRPGRGRSHRGDSRRLPSSGPHRFADPSLREDRLHLFHAGQAYGGLVGDGALREDVGIDRVDLGGRRQAHLDR